VRIKSYFTKNIAEAMSRARTELGPDAVIIASNKTTGETERLGQYEVVFGLPDPTPAVKPLAKTPVGSPPASEGLNRLRSRMEDLRKSVSKKREQASAARMPAPARIAALLVKSGFPSHLSEEIGNAIQSRPRNERQDLTQAVRSEVVARMRVAPKLGLAGNQRKIVAVVGPPGVGKTSTTVKLAVACGLAVGRPPRLISTDTYRLGGSDLLRRYAEAMGVRFSAPGNLDLLEQTLQADEGHGLTIIDTPGLAPAASERGKLLAGFLSKRTDIDVHLALPAYASYTELCNMAARYKSFLPSKLIFTNLDACSSTGSVLATALQEEMPISFFCTGPEVPEDLQEASANELTARLLPSLLSAIESAA
jgi:flagellar biosynthesis protein FlhF